MLSSLTAGGAQVRALVRDPDTARFPSLVEEVRGDLTIPETLDTCLDGIHSVFLVWIAPPATAAPVLERIARHARRIVFFSAPLKTKHPLFQQPNASRALTEHIEQLIEASGLEWTFLRPGMLAANSVRWWAPQIRGGEVVRWPLSFRPDSPDRRA